MANERRMTDVYRRSATGTISISLVPAGGGRTTSAAGGGLRGVVACLGAGELQNISHG